MTLEKTELRRDDLSPANEAGVSVNRRSVMNLIISAAAVAAVPTTAPAMPAASADRPDAKALVNAAMPITLRHLRARKIWIDDALGGAARCRRVALRQRRVAAFVIVGPPTVHVQANRISRIVRLRRRRPY
jgi:hypothetical protein